MNLGTLLILTFNQNGNCGITREHKKVYQEMSQISTKGFIKSSILRPNLEHEYKGTHQASFTFVFLSSYLSILSRYNIWIFDPFSVNVCWYFLLNNIQACILSACFLSNIIHEWGINIYSSLFHSLDIDELMLMCTTSFCS